MPGRGYVEPNRKVWRADLVKIWAPSGDLAEKYKKRRAKVLADVKAFTKRGCSSRRNYKLRSRLYRKHTTPANNLTEAQKEKMIDLRLKLFEKIKKDPRKFGCKKDKKDIRSLAKKMAWQQVMGKKPYTRKESKELSGEA